MKLEAGVQLGGKYTLVQCIGEGSQAEVWLADWVSLGGFTKRVVLKIVARDPKQPSSHDMLSQEARIVSKMRHANIVDVFELGKDEEILYIAMERIKGWDLDDLLSESLSRTEQPFPWPIAARIASQLCLGLDYAHNFHDEDGVPLHLIHRDLKPSNVLVSHEGQVKVIDFGIAKVSNAPKMTQTGIIKGTPAYMSPEQIRSRQLDARTDLFSLGCILYEMCCGQRPFQVPTHADEDIVSTLMWVILEPAKPIDTEALGMPEELADLIRKLLEKDRDHRPSSAFEVHTALDQICFAHGKNILDHQLADFVLGLMGPLEEEPQFSGPALTPMEVSTAEDISFRTTIPDPADDPMRPTMVQDHPDPSLLSMPPLAPQVELNELSLDQAPAFPSSPALEASPALQAGPPLFEAQSSAAPPRPKPSPQTAPMYRSPAFWIGLVLLCLGVGLVLSSRHRRKRPPKKPLSLKKASKLPIPRRQRPAPPAPKKSAKKRGLAPLPRKRLQKKRRPRPRRRRRKIHARRAPQPGTVVIDITPRCRISLDGQYLGISKQLTLSKAPGRYTFRCHADALSLLRSFSVQVQPKRTTHLRKHLVKGSFMIKAHPWGEIWLPGLGKLGKTGKIIRIWEGQYTFQIHKLGSSDTTKRFSLTVRRGDYVELTLRW